MSATKYFAEFFNYFIVITIGCIFYAVISTKSSSIWQNAILIGFLWALIYTTIKIVIRNRIKAKSK